MTTFTTEDRETMQKGLERKPEHYSHYKETIQGASGAQYSFVDTSPQAYEVTQIINTICTQLQALSTVINRMRAELTMLKQLADASLLASKPMSQQNRDKLKDNNCGK